MSLLSNAIAIPQKGGYNLTDSVRFRSSASAYLTRTPSSSGDLQKWTWSSWIKRGVLGGTENFFSQTGGGGTSQRTYFLLGSNDTLTVAQYNGASIDFQLTTTQLFRDPSAWYHIVVAADTTQATASNRLKIYINGEQVTAFSTSTYPSLNLNTYVNSTNQAGIGYDTKVASRYFDGYMTEINHVDGQALTPSDFGEYDDTTGVWKPKAYTGSYGTNGFYLPMKATTQAEGFNTVLYQGNGGSQSITGVGFTPDLIWAKDRSGNIGPQLFDTVRGFYRLSVDQTVAEASTSNIISSFDTDGFSVGSDLGMNGSGKNYVAWCWEAGGTAVSNTNGDIASQVSANTAKGFSVVTYTGAGSNATVGHGLSTTPKVVIVKNRDQTGDWCVYHENMNATPQNYYMQLNLTSAAGANSTIWNNTAPTASTFSVGSYLTGSSVKYAAYCFSEVSGFSKFGSYTGNGSTTGPIITTGFKPAFVMFKCINDISHWTIVDNTRSPSNTIVDSLYADAYTAELTTITDVDFLDNGFQFKGVLANETNVNGYNYIYMAFADTRDFQWNFDASGNKNNWTPNNINSNASSETTYDIMSDVPTLTDEDTGSFCTLNPLEAASASAGTISEGNLKVAGASYNLQKSTWTLTTGKWYCEMTVGAAIDGRFGLTSNFTQDGGEIHLEANKSWFGTANYKAYTSTSLTGSGYSTSASGDVVAMAIDMDSQTVAYYKNGTLIYTDTTLPSNTPLKIFHFQTFQGSFDGVYFNFGQRPFAYTPPTGYKKLNTYNLPDSAIKDGSQYMNTVTYTGNGVDGRDVTVGFQPDLTWIKCRSTGYAHNIADSIRGTNNVLQSNNTAAESINHGAGYLSSFTSDGFQVTTGSVDDNQVNNSGDTYVSWNWRGSDSTAATISAGSIDGTNPTIASTVSANTTSGFSIVTYTGNGSSGTVGHGLGSAPTVYIIKNRSASADWIYFTTQIDGSVDFLSLNTTGIKYNASEPAPTSSIFTLGSSATTVNASGNNYVAYCFAEVEGFSKFGSYTGNGSADGPFVYTGFRPAFILLKNSNTTNGWGMFDVKRDTYNIVNQYLEPNASSAEATYVNWQFDFLSNGFKVKSSTAEANGSGNTIIYMAFASNPFKHSLAH